MPVLLLACVSLAVSLSCDWCVVLSCVSLRPPEVTRGLEIFQDVAIHASTAWGLASRHVGIPVHVWRCRRPSPCGGLDPLRRETSAATVAIHASGGRCSTRPCAHAVGPSSFSAVRRQVWLGGLALTHTTPVGRRAVRRPHSCTCAARFHADCRACAIDKFHWVGMRS